MSLPSNTIQKPIVHKAVWSPRAAPQQRKRGKNPPSLSESGPNSKPFLIRTYFLWTGCPSLILYVIRSLLTPPPPWFSRIYFGFAPSDIPPWHREIVSCIRLENACVRDWARYCRISSGAQYQLHCKWTLPVFTALPLPSRMKFSSRCSSSQRGEGFPPGWKLSDTSAKAITGDSGCRWALIICYFPRYPSSMVFFSPFPSWLCLICSARLTEWMLRKKPNEASGTVLPLPLSLALSCLHPPSYIHPSLLLTAPPHPFIFYLLLSFPLIHTQR